MSDIEEDWVPNGRPKSTLARSFSAALDNAFKLDLDVNDLSQAVEQKKRNVTTRQSELEALEAKLRETEERLKEKTSRSSSPRPVVNGSSYQYQNHPKNSPQRRSALKGVFEPTDETRRPSNESLLDKMEPMTPTSDKGMGQTERGDNMLLPTRGKGQGQWSMDATTQPTFLQEQDHDQSS